MLLKLGISLLRTQYSGFSLENLVLFSRLTLKSGVGQNTTMHASPTARNFVLVLISTSPVHSTPFVTDPLPTY